jgi:membrane protease YdiL (CAAX protease family)
MAVEPPFREPPEETPDPETFRAVESGLAPDDLRSEGEEYPSVLPVAAPGGDQPLTMQPGTTRAQPGFFVSLLLCVAFVLITQVPAAVIAIIVLFILFAVKSQGMNQLLDQSALANSDEFSIALMPAMWVAEALVIGVSWFAIRLVVGKEWPRKVGLRLPSVTQIVLVLLAFPGLVLLGNGSYELLKQVLPSFQDLIWPLLPGSEHQGPGGGPAGMEEMVQVFSKWPWSFAVLVIGLGPGIGEELWCRAFLGRGLVGRYGVILGVVFTSFFFGLIHLDPQQGTMAMLMGLVLHFVYLTTRSLLMPMLLHFMNNSLAVVASRFAVTQAMEQTPEQTPWWMSALVYGTSGLLLLAVGWALYRGRARLAALEGWPAWQPDFPGVEHPPRNSGTVVIRPWPGWTALILVASALVAFVATFAAFAMQAQAGT